TLRGIGGTLLHWWCCMHHQCSAQFHQTPGRRAEETAKNSNSQRHRFTRWTRWTARGMESPDQSHRHEAASNCESRVPFVQPEYRTLLDCLGILRAEDGHKTALYRRLVH